MGAENGKLWEPDDDTRTRIAKLAQIGLPLKTICDLEGVAPNTLRKHCRDELARGKARGAQQAMTLLTQMMSGYRTVRNGGIREVDEKTQYNANVKHLALVHGIYEGKAQDDASVTALPWSDDRAATAENVTRSEDN